MYKKHNGFSLLELLIVISIFTILTTLLVANQRKFSNNIFLSGLADDVALTIREAQSYGLGSKDTAGTTQGSFSKPYGMYIDKNHNNQYVLFADTSKPDGYNIDLSDTIIRTYTFPQGNTIDHFCVIPSAGVASKICSGSTLTSMSVTFLRPNPDAKIIGNDGTLYTQATICITSQAGKQKQVEVMTSGQIAVVDTCD